MSDDIKTEREETEDEARARRAKLSVRLIQFKDKKVYDDPNAVLSAEEVGRFVGQIPSDIEQSESSSD